MDKVKIRAISEIKLATKNANLTYKYPAGSPFDNLAGDIIHTMIQNKGTKGTKEWIEGFISAYDPEYKGLQ